MSYLSAWAFSNIHLMNMVAAICTAAGVSVTLHIEATKTHKLF